MLTGNSQGHLPVLLFLANHSTVKSKGERPSMQWPFWRTTSNWFSTCMMPCTQRPELARLLGGTTSSYKSSHARLHSCQIPQLYFPFRLPIGAASSSPDAGLAARSGSRAHRGRCAAVATLLHLGATVTADWQHWENRDTRDEGLMQMLKHAYALVQKRKLPWLEMSWKGLSGLLGSPD